MMRASAGSLWCVVALGASLGAGCAARTPQEDLAAFTRASGTLALPDDVHREAVQAYAPHAARVDAGDAHALLAGLHQLGLRRAELTAAFGLAIEAQEGTAGASATCTMLRWLFRPGAPPAKVQEFLRVRRDASVAKAHEGMTVKGVQKLVLLKADLVDTMAFLEGLPAAKAAGVDGEAFELYAGLWKLRLPVPLRAECYRHGIGAGARKMDLGEYLWFVGELRRWNRAEAELLAYVAQVARSAGPSVDRAALASGFDAVGLLPIPEAERVRLFGGTLAAAANGADPEGIKGAIGALAAAKVPPATLQRMTEATLQALSRYPAAAVEVAVRKALDSKLEGDALAEELASQLSLAAAGGRRGGPRR